ncbi:MAG: lysine-sensitive aspartokinase 3 [Spirochaetia bacterium]|nr:lysine-sensitive aspartokinase 3 [Spirochaetia bacterium]
MIVLKFGGTSVQDSSSMNRALAITAERIDKAPVLISSAMAKITDSLIETTVEAVAGNGKRALEIVDAIKERHLKCAYEFLKGKNLDYAGSRINEIITELRSILRGCAYLKECSPQSYDAVISCGELLSTVLLHARALEMGIDAVWLDSRQLIKTDSVYGEAAVDFDATAAAVRNAISPQPGRLYIAQGFIGSDSNSLTTTLGRGGSDYTAAIFGSILDAQEIQIWTDVNGIMTTDPRLVPEAKTINEISYEEAAELAFFGAKVVHPATIQPAVSKKIPVTVLNTRDPEGIFTRIAEKTAYEGLKAISGKKNVTLVTVVSSRMMNAVGFLARLFAIFQDHNTSVDLVSTSEVSVSMTINKTDKLAEIRTDLEKLGSVSVGEDKAIVCLVGKGIWKDSRNITKAFAALEGTNIRMISLGASDTNLSALVPSHKLNEAIVALHKAFFG